MSAPTAIYCATREAWLKARRDGIGASEIAAVMGISPWDSPFSLYWRKVEGWTVDDNDEMKWGRLLEDPIAVEWADRHLDVSVINGGLFQSATEPWMLATPDRLVCRFGPGPYERVAVLEVKTAGSLDGWGEDGSDEIPVHYRAQVLWQMAVMDLPVAHVALLARGTTYREYVIERDEADIATMVAAGAEFWDRVRTGTPPPIDQSEPTTHALRRLNPPPLEGEVEITPMLAEQYRAAKRDLGTLEARVRGYENELRQAMGSARYVVSDGARVADRRVFSRTSVDSKRLRAEHPDIYAVYSSTSTVDALYLAPDRSKT